MALFPLLLAGAMAATPTASSQPAPDAGPIHPALWVVKNHGTTIYLFGTFHALDGTTNWFKGDVKSAFERSQELILETLVPEFPKASDDAAVSGPATARFAAKAAPPLPSAGPVLPQIAPEASFLASTRVVMAASHARGMSSAEGADAVLREAAEDCGKPVDGLESFQYQLSLFTSLPSPAPAATRPDPAMLRNISIALAQLQDAWNRGDIAAFDPMLAQMRAQSPESYKVMFIKRNAHWAHWIADRLHKPGVIFVAVGAGHLAGPDSVENQLAGMGIRATRID